MPLRVLIVPDKFKGTLTAHAAAEAIAAGWRKSRPDDKLKLLPMSDGGDGFGEVLGELLQAKPKTVTALDAAHRPRRTHWWMDRDGRTAIIDSAAIIGLAQLPKGKFHPFQLDSFGLGQVMLAATQAGAARGIVGIGGSATNDGGFGMARALGWKFFNKNWDELTEWWQLHELAHMRHPPEPLHWKITVAVDVSNPLLGARGCSRVYGPQKGLQPADFPLADKCLARLAAVLKANPKTPGTGAAGGLGFGLMAMAGAKLEPGFEIFAGLSRLDDHIRNADLVLTGEGKLDPQTHMGKGVGKIALLCARRKTPCIALAGMIEDPKRAGRLFLQTHALFGDGSKAARRLEKLAAEVAKAFAKR